MAQPARHRRRVHRPRLSQPTATSGPQAMRSPWHPPAPLSLPAPLLLLSCPAAEGCIGVAVTAQFLCESRKGSSPVGGGGSRHRTARVGGGGSNESKRCSACGASTGCPLRSATLLGQQGQSSCAMPPPPRLACLPFLGRSPPPFGRTSKATRERELTVVAPKWGRRQAWCGIGAELRVPREAAAAKSFGFAAAARGR